MFNSAQAYEADTVVVDVDERQPARPTPRRTEELTMQILHAGDWHRRMPDLTATACDKVFHSQFSPVRREELTHPLCRTCFTAAELARADTALRNSEP